MADHCCKNERDACRAPRPLMFPATNEAVQHQAGDGCRPSGAPVFDGLDPRYKRILWTVIGINGAMFLTEMLAGQLAGSQALKADAFS
jgi:Co/Zn/Cd efflux system component